MVMASEHGFTASFAMKVGKFSVCWGCKQELKEKGFLHPRQHQYLLPSGKLVGIRQVQHLLNAYQASSSLLWLRRRRR